MATWTRATLLKRIGEVMKEELDVDMFTSEGRAKLSGYTMEDLTVLIEKSIIDEAMRHRIR